MLSLVGFFSIRSVHGVHRSLLVDRFNDSGDLLTLFIAPPFRPSEAGGGQGEPNRWFSISVRGVGKCETLFFQRVDGGLLVAVTSLETGNQ